MTVQEMIDELSEYDRGLEVQAQGTNEWTTDIDLILQLFPEEPVLKIIGIGPNMAETF